MDAFYASVEERDHPQYRGQPIAVGGSSRRGVLTTANYEARKYGCRSAMPGFKALELCPHLVILPIRFDVYRAESAKVRAIFGRFTELIEPLSLDEAYLDVSHLKSSGATVAREIRRQIFEETGLTASAGIASNKMLAKIASDWQKPNGQYEVKEGEIGDFMKSLPVGKLWGVGKKMQEKLKRLKIETCGDLQAMSKVELADRLGQWGLVLYDLAQGRDDRAVETERVRKSLSQERTFQENLTSLEQAEQAMESVVNDVEQELAAKGGDEMLKSLFVKLKFADFERTTAEKAHRVIDRNLYRQLLAEAWSRGLGREVRLIGAGVRFRDPEAQEQLELLDFGPE